MSLSEEERRIMVELEIERAEKITENSILCANSSTGIRW